MEEAHKRIQLANSLNRENIQGRSWCSA